MGYKSGVLGRFGIRGACIALLWLAIAAASVGSADAKGLPSLTDKAVVPHKQPGLTVLAAQLDFTVADLQFEPGADVPLRLRVPSEEQLKRAGGDRGAFVLVRNLPEGIIFSEGMPIGTNWVMSLPQSEQARLLAKHGAAGSHRIEFLLIGPGNRVLAETSVVVQMKEPKPKTDTGGAPGAEPSDRKPVAALNGSKEPEKRQAAPIKPAKPSISREEETILLAKGAELIGQGGIAAARLIFEELAQQGSREGALALARTYDPAYTGAAPAGSIVPNIPKALSWYERAAELGSGEALQRISQLTPQR